MKKHAGHKHTGPIRAHHHLAKGIGKKDPLASAEHNAANAAHGMPQGLSPAGEGYNDHDGDEGGEMGGNCCNE